MALALPADFADSEPVGGGSGGGGGGGSQVPRTTIEQQPIEEASAVSAPVDSQVQQVGGTITETAGDLLGNFGGSDTPTAPQGDAGDGTGGTGGTSGPGGSGNGSGGSGAGSGGSMPVAEGTGREIPAALSILIAVAASALFNA